VERLKKCTAAGLEDLKEHGDAAMEQVKQLVFTEMARMRSLMERMVAVGAVQDVRARDLLIEGLRRPPPSGLVAHSADPTVVEAGAAASIPVTATKIMAQVEVPAAILRVRESVRTLQAKGKLAGVPLFNEHGECVPLIEMMPDLRWGQALEEYAEGRHGMASIVEVQQLFGNRWRLRHSEPKRDRYIKLYSEWAALYRAFDTEYVRRGGVAGIRVDVNSLKQRYGPWDRNSKAVLKELRRDYPDPNRGTRKRARVEVCAASQLMLPFSFALRHHSTTQMQLALRKVEASVVLSLPDFPPPHLPLLRRLAVKENRSIFHPMRAPAPPSCPPSTKPHTAATCRSCCSPTLAPHRISRPPLVTDPGTPLTSLTLPSPLASHALPTHCQFSHRRRPLPQYTRITPARTASASTAAALSPTLDAAASPPTPAAGAPSCSVPLPLSSFPQ